MGELKALIADALSETAARFRPPVDMDSISALLAANGGVDGLDPYYLGTLQLHSSATAAASATHGSGSGAHPSLSLQVPSSTAAGGHAQPLESPAYSHPASLHLTSAGRTLLLRYKLHEPVYEYEYPCCLDLLISVFSDRRITRESEARERSAGRR